MLLNAIDLKNTDKEGFQAEYFGKSKPVRVTGIPPSTLAYTKWTFPFFETIGAEIELDLSDDPLRRGITTSKSSLREYSRAIQTKTTDLYANGWPFEQTHPDLLEDFSLPDFHPDDFIDTLPPSVRFRRKWIFLGVQGILSDLHVDAFTTNAWLMLIHGVKTVRLISPLHLPYVTGSDSLFDENLIRSLDKKNVDVLQMALMPGTVGYVPSGWMHQVKNETDTVMVTGNFSTRLDVARFYPNFRRLVTRDANRCDAIFTEYVSKIAERALSEEHVLAIKQEQLRLQGDIDAIAGRLRLLDRLLAPNN